MGRPNLVGNKRRTLHSDTLLEADGQFPAFPTGSATPVLFAGDFKGAEIIGFEFSTGAFTTVTNLDATIQHSMDGVIWHTLKALTQATGAANTQADLDDGDPEPFRFLRVDLSATGAYGSVASVAVRVIFRQPGARGPWSPPGMPDVTH